MSGAEVKFTRERENANDADETENAYVTIMETQRTASPHQAGSKVTPERVAVVVLSLLLAAALIDRGFNYYRHIQTNESFQNMTNELQALKRNLTETRGQEKSCKPEQCTCPTGPTETRGKEKSCKPEQCTCPTGPTGESCLKCEPGWEQHGGKCYQFSAGRFPWETSRDQCQNSGGDLVKIDSREEQEFLEGKLRGRMRYADEKLWIGLTDSEEEGRWLWADGSPLDNSLSFWRPGEPNDSKREDSVNGEDCVMMGEEGTGGRKGWIDKSCQYLHRFICEKAAETGRAQCVFGSS